MEDVAAANLLASRMPLEDHAAIDARAFNMAIGEEIEESRQIPFGLSP